MYPKLKVRSQEQDVRRYGVGSNPSLPGLKALHSLFHGDFSSPGPAKKESKPISKKLEAEVPSPCKLGSITPLSASKDKNERGEEDNIRPHIRASSIPRPRAVLSSPNNDDMIGGKTKRRIEKQTSALKPHELGQNCSITTKHSGGGRPNSRREGSEETTNKSDIHKPPQLGPRCTNVTLKQSSAERLKSGREAPEAEETSSKSDVRGNKGSATTIRVKK